MLTGFFVFSTFSNDSIIFKKKILNRDLVRWSILGLANVDICLKIIVVMMYRGLVFAAIF